MRSSLSLCRFMLVSYYASLSPLLLRLNLGV